MGVYTIFQADGDDAAAVYQAPPGMPTAWAVYFAVIDVKASAALIDPLGGKVIMGPMDIGESGSMVVAQDPQGAYFSLWQGKQQIGATNEGPTGRVVWPELHTTDCAAAIKFYGSLLGWKTKPETGAETAPYVEWVNAGTSMGGMMPIGNDAGQGMPPYWAIYITVADCDERVKHAQEIGGKVCMPPMDIPNVGRFAVVADPQGGMFCPIQMGGAQRPATA